MAATFDHSRGKVRAFCTIRGCGYMSVAYKEVEADPPDTSGATAETQARFDLAFHNYRSHPGVFPRWNPTIEAVEKERRPRERRTDE